MDSAAPALTDPFSILIGLGAICALVAGVFWFRVASSIESKGQAVNGPNLRALSHAALTTGLALVLAGAGYLLGRYTGRF